MSNNQGTKLEMLKSVKNQQSNAQLNKLANSTEKDGGFDQSEQHREEQEQERNKTNPMRVRFQDNTTMEEVEAAIQQKNDGMDTELQQETVLTRENESNLVQNEEPNDDDTVLWDNTTSNQNQILQSLQDMVDQDVESPNDKEVNNTIDDTNNIQEMNKEAHQNIGVTFRMEFNAQSNPTEESVVKTLFSKVSELLQRWLNHREIIGIVLEDGSVMKEGVNQRAQEWTKNYRVLYQKKVIYGETYLRLKSPLKVIQLHASVKDLCSKYHIRLESKHMMKGFTKRIGFLVGPYVNAASRDFYEKQLGKQNDQLDGSIEIKKQMTYESGVRSKVLVVYGMEHEADKIDMKIMANQYEGFKYLSYKRSKTEERVASMHYNDIINVKARFEILFGAKGEDVVQYNGKTSKLKRLLLDLKEGDERLFLAVEQGAGIAKNNIQVILNPQMKDKAKQWLVKEYPSIIFKYQSENKTSVNAEDVGKKSKYSEDLKAFLSPVLTHKDAIKVKKYGKKVKTYAQALGIENTNNSKVANNLKTKNTEKAKQKKTEEVGELQNTIKNLEAKIQKLLEMITILTSTIGDETKREKIIEALQSIHHEDSKGESKLKNRKEKQKIHKEVSGNEVLPQNKENELLGKRKQQTHTTTSPSGYNIEQQDLSGQICQYIQVEDCGSYRKRKIANYHNNE